MAIAPEIRLDTTTTVAQYLDACAGRAEHEVIVVVLMRACPGLTRRERYQAQDHLVTELLRSSHLVVRRIDLIDEALLDPALQLAMVCDADSGEVLWDLRLGAPEAAGPCADVFHDPEEQISHLTRDAKVTSFWT